MKSVKQHIHQKSSSFHKTEDLIQLGVVAQAHGIYGEIRVHLFNPDSESLWDAEDLLIRRKGSKKIERVVIEDVRGHTKGILLALEGCMTRTEAEALRGSEIFLPHKELPELEEDEFYFHELEGLPVFDANSGEQLGKVLRVTPSYGQNLLTFKHQDRECFVPIVNEFIPVIDVENKRIEINVIPGLLD